MTDLERAKRVYKDLKKIKKSVNKDKEFTPMLNQAIQTILIMYGTQIKNQ